jgi:hypothetical protein
MWWLPDNEEHKVAGRLVWDQKAGGTLELLGQLRPDTWEDNALPDGSVQRVRVAASDATKALVHPLIHGQAKKTAYTLLSGISLQRRSEMEGDYEYERVRVERVLESEGWFTDGDDLRFDEARVDMRHLTAWVNHTGLDLDLPDHRSEDRDLFASLTARSLPRMTVGYGDGIVSLGQRLSTAGDRLHSVTVEQRWILVVSYPFSQPINFLADIASDVQDLVSIAAGKTADFESVRFTHPDLPLLSAAGTPIGSLRADVNYYARWTNRSEPTAPVGRYDLYFTFDDFGGIEGLGRWLQVAATFRTELARVMATRYSSSMYLEDRLMNVCAALESYDRIRRNETSHSVTYVDRIRECTNFAGEPFDDLIVGDGVAWATKVKDLRHDLAHHKDRFRTGTTSGDHVLKEQVYWLFVFCILRSAAAPDAAFQSIMRHAQIGWLIEQAQTFG